MKVRELLDSPEKWIKGALARDKNGNKVLSQDENAIQWCLVGAIVKCQGYVYYTDMAVKIERAITKCIEQPFNNLVDFNNDENTTFEDIQKVLELADV